MSDTHVVEEEIVAALRGIALDWRNIEKIPQRALLALCDAGLIHLGGFMSSPPARPSPSGVLVLAPDFAQSDAYVSWIRALEARTAAWRAAGAVLTAQRRLDIPATCRNHDAYLAAQDAAEAAQAAAYKALRAHLLKENT
jgi:hypothetical protein